MQRGHVAVRDRHSTIADLKWELREELRDETWRQAVEACDKHAKEEKNAMQTVQAHWCSCKTTL